MAAAVFDNTHKFDIGSWNWTFNATQYVPSAKDLAFAGPRMFMKLGSFLAFPGGIDHILSAGGLGGRIIPEATGAGIVDAATTAVAGGARDALQAGTQILVDVDEPVNGMTSRFTLEGVRSISNVFSYATSKWALGCVIVAIILNRTYVYASTRRNLVLPWKIRLLLRAIPILLLTFQARSVLQSIQCQTSPDFGLLRWGNASKSSELMFTQNGGFLHELSQTLLFRASDEDSCLAVRMIDDDASFEVGPDGKLPPSDTVGSLSLLWPLFKSFSFSQFIETISCAVQGRQVAGETGMTLFEHSLAFAEADAAIGNQLGFGSFGTTSSPRWPNSTSTAEATEIAITRSMIMKKVNTTPEVLLVGFLSAMNHLTSHILAVFNAQGRFRLVNTGLWGLSFMAAIVVSVWNFSLDEELGTQSLLRFPTVCIIGFIPHVLVLCGIVGCSFIYVAALALSALAPPQVEDADTQDDEVVPINQSTFIKRFVAAHNNMQANVQLASIKVTLHMDFYTALLRTGFAVMTMASEAVYLNESRGVSIKQRTWLEEERLREIEQFGAQWLGPTFRLHDPDFSVADGLTDNVGLVAARDQPMDLLQKSSSGYAREMTAKTLPKLGKQRDVRGAGLNGVGATERSGRWIMALEFFLGISRLLLSWWASLTLKGLATAGWSGRPQWLVYLARMPKKSNEEKEKPSADDPDSLNFYLLSIDGELTLPRDDHVDVEAEMRERLLRARGEWGDHEEKNLDSNLYSWWLNGGWWGADDGSGQYKPDDKELDDDTTSVVSFSTTENGEDQEWISDGDNDDGRRTPTQRYPEFSRESTPLHDTPLNPADLAQLLNPKTPEQRAQAEALAAHLGSDNIVTRSRYRNIVQRERAKVLTSTRHRPDNFAAASTTGKLAPHEEAQILEHLIISGRACQSATTSTPRPTSWARGASGMGEGGPQCVVCQSSPRSIIVWPCRCLSLCDDCRVTLAMNNFDKCVCCRRDVASFSRIFVP